MAEKKVTPTTRRRRNAAERDHEITLAVIDALKENENLIYIAMVAGGTAVSALTPETDEEKSIKDQILGFYTGTMKMSGIGGIIGAKLIQDNFGDAPSSWQDFAARGLKAGATNIAVFGATMLILNAIFGGGKSQGGIAGLVGGLA